MKIENSELWESAPEETKETARSVLIGASVARWLLYILPDATHPELQRMAGTYRITWQGPADCWNRESDIPQAVTVAQNS